MRCGRPFPHAVLLSLFVALVAAAASALGAQPIASKPVANGQRPVQAGPAAPVLVAIVQLVERGAAYDGMYLAIEGEIIGDVMRRGEHAWLSLLQDGIAVGVWVAATDIPAGSMPGGYSAQGDLVRIGGVMHRACPEHGGDLDFHATRIERIEPGRAVFHPAGKERLVAGLALSAAGVGLAFYWRRRERDAGVL
jgi:hypothetical protein